MVVEKRKYYRFMVRPDTYAALGPQYTKVGKVRQISIGGLAFEYICITENENIDQHSTKIALFLCENQFFLPNIPCRVISDLPNGTLDKDPMFDSIYTVNRCAVQYKNITEHQQRRLDYFLEHHTRGFVPMANEMIPAQSFSGTHFGGKMPAPVHPKVSTLELSE